MAKIRFIILGALACPLIALMLPADLRPLVNLMHVITIVALLTAGRYLRNLHLRIDMQTEELQHRTTHDSLTGLPNRILLSEKAMYLLETSTHTLGIIFIDLNKFKSINDTYGHAAGDIVLKAVTEAMLSVKTDHETLARFAGDEFVVLLEQADEQLIEETATRMRQAIEQAYIIFDETRISIAASTGSALVDLNDLDKEKSYLSALTRADGHMYLAKQTSRSQGPTNGMPVWLLASGTA